MTQAHPDGREPTRLGAQRDQQPDDDAGCDDGDDRPESFAATERHPTVEGKVELQRPEHLDLTIGTQDGDCPVLGPLIDDDDDYGQQDTEPAKMRRGQLP